MHFKLAQIDTYNWLTTEMVEQCHDNMENHISRDMFYEFIIDEFTYVSKVFGKINFEAVVDGFDEQNDEVWEFKCVDHITIEHLLQVIVYAWLWEKCMIETFGFVDFKIMNIRTSEIRMLRLDWHLIYMAVDLLLHNKFDTIEDSSDSEFITNCLDDTIDFFYVDSLRNIMNKIDVYAKNIKVSQYLDLIGIKSADMQSIYSNNFVAENKKLCMLLINNRQILIKLIQLSHSIGVI